MRLPGVEEWRYQQIAKSKVARLRNLLSKEQLGDRNGGSSRGKIQKLQILNLRLELRTIIQLVSMRPVATMVPANLRPGKATFLGSLKSGLIAELLMPLYIFDLTEE